MNTYPSKTLPKTFRRRNTPILFPFGHHHLETKTRERYHTYTKLQANITDKNRYKNPQKILAIQMQQYIKRIAHCSQV